MVSIRRTISTSAAVALATVALWAPPAIAAYEAGKAQKEKPVPGVSVQPTAATAQRTGKPFSKPAPVWPKTGAPVTTQDLGTVRVEAVGGEKFRLTRADSKTATGRVSIDYNKFRWAYGGDWAGRLRLRVLPECALMTPAAPQCRGSEVETVNDTVRGVVSAVINVDGPIIRTTTVRGEMEGIEPTVDRIGGGTLVALTSAASGGGGDYRATTLAPSASWSAGGNSGDFSWTYAMRTPPSLGGPAPGISLGYSSSSVDGKMASTNSQPSMFGEGFDWHPGFIERSYIGCGEDMANGANNTVKSGDQCWGTDNASLSMAGHAGELLKDPDPAKPNRWHLRSDDGTYVDRRTGASNGDNDGEYWVVTTPDGTQHWFGGRTGSNAALNSTVFGNHVGDPCRQPTFAASSCSQTYRWQLDYVVDKHGNTMSLTYEKETNKYGRNNSTTDLVTYDRAGYVKRIDYGTRVGSTGEAPMSVEFTMAERCLSACTIKDAAHFPDVPFDQECNASPCYVMAPTYWTTKRVSNVITRVRNAAGTAYDDVESWTFTHSFPDPEDNITAALWLDKISHSGLKGGTTPTPDVVFHGAYRANRVDTLNDQLPAMNKFRISSIVSEAGGTLGVLYKANDCVKGIRVPDVNALQDNKLRCYPVKWTPSGHTAPITDFFHKTLVVEVTESDSTGSSNRVITKYDYVGDPAWRYTEDNGLTKPDSRTWAVWRGYERVSTVMGDTGEQTRSDARFFRGMHGDKIPGGTRSVSIDGLTDEDAFAGMTRETITYDGPLGAVVTSELSTPWQSNPTASRTVGTTVHARFVGVQKTVSRTTLDGPRGVRETTELSKFDEFGMVSEVEDLGEAVAGDESCMILTYQRDLDPAKWTLANRARERKFSVDCAKAKAGPLTDKDIVGDELYTYNSAWDLTKSETLKAYNGGSPTYLQEDFNTYDAYGRVLESTDVRGNVTKTAYTPANGGPLTSVTETSPLLWTKTTVLEPAWGVAKSTTDTNGRIVNFGYDGLGRLTAVWLPGRATNQTPNISHSYLIRNNAATVVISKKLNPAGVEIASYKFYDPLLRERQTQESDGAGGPAAVVSDVYYDTAGRMFLTHESYVAADQNLNPVAPSTNLFRPTGTIPRMKQIGYDGVGRSTMSKETANGPSNGPGGSLVALTTTRYGGDRTDVIGPNGSIVTSTLTDAEGRTSELRQYHAGVNPSVNTPASDYDVTKYSYNTKGQAIGVVDPLNNTWEYKYDIRGRVYEQRDPDKGTVQIQRNDYGDVMSTTDGAGAVLAYAYDSVGRIKTLKDGQGNKRTEWFYDALPDGSPAVGQMVKTVRYTSHGEYVKAIDGFTADYKPTGVTYTIPGTGVGGTYSYLYTHHEDGSLATTRMPGMGGLGTEQLTYGYDSLGQASTLNTNLGGTYVTGTEYTAFSELGAVHLRHNSGAMADIAQAYATDTRRLEKIWTTRQTAPSSVADVRYGYDTAGNVTKVSDVVGNDYQCFTTDYLRRLTEAKASAASDCSGTLKYQQTFEYDLVGNRKKMVDGTRTVDYVNVGHKVMSTSDGGSYAYYATGDMKTRTTPAGTQTMTWDPEGHLATTNDSTGDTSYVYDVDGSRLARIDPAGTTLYLPGQELRYNKSSSLLKGTRYYTHAGLTVAMRDSTGVTWLSADHHGSAQISVKAVGQAVALRRETPFGDIRATTGTWPSTMDKGFVGGTKDNTGLTHLGAREFDTGLGRFISRDPISDMGNPQQLHGYAYGNNSPVTTSDASGLCWPAWLCDRIAKLSAKAPSYIRQGRSWLQNKFDQARDWVGDKVDEAKAKVKDTFNDGLRWIASTAVKVKERLKETWKKVQEKFDAAKKWVKDTAQAIKDAIDRAAAATARALNTAVRRGWQVTRAIINGPLTMAVTGLALAGGGKCGMNGQELMVVCTRVPKRMYGRGGTTIGNAFITDKLPDTAEGRKGLMSHEAKHADQWAMSTTAKVAGLPLGFPVAYFTAEAIWPGDCNPFERWAGEGGGYDYSKC